MAAVLAQGLNTTDVLWDNMQHSPYFNYKAADGLIHQVRTWAGDTGTGRERRGCAALRCALQCSLSARSANVCTVPDTVACV